MDATDYFFNTMTSSGQEGPRKELLNAMFRLKAATFGRCFAPPSLCVQPPIHAHRTERPRARSARR